ncbi:MAG: isocitrate lyase/phosphoenolpyruvate mutase family protein, partial [Alphaproteobacteria bacterium]
SGLIIEDQVWPKRCGHMAGKAVIPATEMVQKVKAAVDARQDDDLIIRARTDAAGPLGINEAIDRLKLYAEAGADILFADALLTAGDEPIDRPDLLVSFDELNALTGFDELDRMDEKYSVAETVGHAAV